MRKFFLSLVVAAVLLPLQAFAGEIYFNAAGFEGLKTGTASCAKTANESDDAGDHVFITGNFDASTDEGCVFHFYWQSDMPTSGSVDAVYIDGTGTGAGNVRFDVDIRCDTDADGALEAGVTSSVTQAVGAGTYATEAFPLVDLPTSIAAGQLCGLRIYRDADNAGEDNATGDYLVRGAWFTY